MSCADKNNDAPLFSFDESKLKEQYLPEEVLELSIQNNNNKKVDSITYRINDTIIAVKKGLEKLTFELKNQKFGYQNLKAEIYSYSRSKGFFAGVALDGTVIRIDRKANETVYGDMASPASIFDGRTQTQSQAIIDFRNQLEEGSSRQAKK